MSRNLQSLKVAAISMTSGPNKEQNVNTALRLVREAAGQGADWVQLPEMWPYMGNYDDLYGMAEEDGGPLCQALANTSKECGIVLIAGTVGERPVSDTDRRQLSQKDLVNPEGQRRVFNTTYVFGRQGEVLAKYRKIHLFNLVGEDGQARYMESSGYIPGDRPVVVTIEGWRLGLSICYDLRFPELYGELMKETPLDVIAVPSAFTKMTGSAHWELLLRARAVERQCYVYAANQTGVHALGKESFGHSMIIDPWGLVLSNTGTDVGIGYATVDKQVIASVRSKLPALANRRPSLFSS